MRLNYGEYNTKSTSVDYWTWCCSTVPVEEIGFQPRRDEWVVSNMSEIPGQCPCCGRGGVWPLAVSVLPYLGPLGTIFLQKVLPSLCHIWVDRRCLSFIFVPFWDERGAIIWGGAHWGCSAFNILFCFPWGVTVPVSQHTCSGQNIPNTPPTSLGISQECAHANTAAYPVRRSICLVSPNLGEEGRLIMAVRFAFSFGEASSLTVAIPATCLMVKIRRLEIKLPMVKAIWTGGHTFGQWGNQRIPWKRQSWMVAMVKKGHCPWGENKLPWKDKKRKQCGFKYG